MKCTKCGAECDSRQLFCLRCGTPLNSNKSEDEVIREVEVPIENMVEAISVEEDDDIDLIIGRDLSRVRSRNNFADNAGDSGIYNQITDTDREYVKRYQKDLNSGAGHRNTESKKSNNAEHDLEADKKAIFSKSNKKLYIGLGIGGAVIIIVIIAAVIFFGKSGKFDEYYKNGMNLYDKGKVQQSITQFNKASDIAGKDEDRIEADIMLWKAYSQLEGYENELVDVLIELINLEPDNASYYEALIIVYQGMDDQAAIDKLISSVKDAELHAQLKDFDGTTPVPTLTAGDYDKPVSIGLTAMSGSTIYYTVNGGSATTSSEKYTTSIELKEEGEYTIRAIAVDSKGKKSRQMESKYILKFGTVNAPVINLDSGTYNERKKIKVTADAGCKVYYTTDQSMPTDESKEYTKAFKIPEDNTVYRFVAIDEKGIASDIVTRVYRYERVYKYSYDDAISGLSDVLISIGIMENSFGTYEDGSVMYFEYESIEEVEKERYYIINAIKESEMGTTISNETYAYGCDSAVSYKAKLVDGEYELSEIKK